mgnify:CR=1 FL=1
MKLIEMQVVWLINAYIQRCVFLKKVKTINITNVINNCLDEISISGKLMLKGFKAKLKKMYVKRGAKK